MWSEYCNLVSEIPDSNICLAERSQEVMPLLIKFTFRYNFIDENQRFYDNKFLQWICYYCQQVLNENYDINDFQLESTVAILESITHWVENNEETGERSILNEIRLQFPYAKIHDTEQYRIIRPRLIQLLRNNNVISKMTTQPLNEWEQIISSTLVNKPVVMYGSSESMSKPKLRLTHIWSQITQEILN